jgi:hypothetical protein
MRSAQLFLVIHERQLQMIQAKEKVASHSLRLHQLRTVGVAPASGVTMLASELSSHWKRQTQLNPMRPVLIGAARINRSLISIWHY